MLSSPSLIRALFCHHLLLIALLAARSTASPAAPPSFFATSPPRSHNNPTILPLRAPTTPNLDPASHQHLSQRTTLARRRNNLLLHPRSSSNPHDKLQTLAYHSGAYQAPLHLSRSQLVFVQLDTGSSDLWVVSSTCSTPQCDTADVLKFDAAKSPTFRRIEVDPGANASFANRSASRGISKRRSGNETEVVPFSIVYSDTTYAEGGVVSDSVTLSNLSVASQAFALVEATNVTLGQQAISGVLGLGFPRGSVVARSLLGYDDAEVETRPLMTSLLQMGGETAPMFGLYLTRDAGRMTIGAVDPAVLPTKEDREQVEWYTVYPFPSGDTSLPANATLNIDGPQLGSYVQWVIPLTAAGVGGVPATLTADYPAGTLALIDSGSSSILGPPADVSSLFAPIKNSRHVGGGRFVVPCDTTDRMYFSFGGRNITLLPTDYLIGPDAQQPYLCFAWPAAAPVDADGVGWILGTPFLRAVYSVFSIGVDGKEPPKVGLFPLRQPASATQSAVVFRPQPTQQLSSFLEQATKVDSVLPNSLVSLQTGGGGGGRYVFENATVTPSIGVLPTGVVGAPSSYKVALPTARVGKGADLPVIASSSEALPLPSNPALANGAGGGGGGMAAGMMTMSLLSVVVVMGMML